MSVLAVPDFTVARDILYRKVENEAVLLHITSAMYYSLNETGVLFWEGLRNQTPDQVIAQVAEEYGVETTQIHQDLMTFLTDLATHGIINWVAKD